MKSMVSGLLILSLGMFGCSSQKKLTADPPFVISQAVCQTWVGGREESGKGMDISFQVDGLEESQVQLHQLYFRGRIGDLTLTSKEDVMHATCNFTEQTKEIAMHSDPMKEVGNQPPRIKSKDEKAFPFELQPQEAVISYTQGSKMKYYKIAEIAEKPGRFYPGREKE